MKKMTIVMIEVGDDGCERRVKVEIFDDRVFRKFGIHAENQPWSKVFTIKVDKKRMGLAKKNDNGRSFPIGVAFFLNPLKGISVMTNFMGPRSGRLVVGRQESFFIWKLNHFGDDDDKAEESRGLGVLNRSSR